MRSRHLPLLLACTCLLFLSACGGSRGRNLEGKAVPPPKPPPVVPAAKAVPMDPALVDAARQEVQKALEHQEAAICANALEVYSRTAPPPEVAREILAKLTERNGAVRLAAAMAAGDAKVHEALPVLQRMVNDPEPVVRVAVRYALHRLGDTRRSHDLEKTARDPDDFVRRQTALVLGRLGDPTAVKILRVMRRDRDPAVRQQAVEAMWRLGDERGMKELVGWTYSQYVDDREFALMALAAPRDKRVRGIVRNALTAEHLEVALTAAAAMGMLESDEGYGVALVGAKDTDAIRKVRAADAMGAIGRTDAQDPLRKMLAHDSPIVRLRAAAAILQIDAKERA